MAPRSTVSEAPRNAAVCRRRIHPERNVFVTSRASMASEVAAGGRAMITMVTCGHDASRPAPRERPVSDAAAVEDANAEFYRAFESLEIAEMDRVWVHGDHVCCVHPGWPLLRGWPAVRRSWQRIFASTAEMRFTISDVTVNLVGDLAWVTCVENILSEVGERVSVTAILATNLFERTETGWRLVHHHASHVLAPAA